MQSYSCDSYLTLLLGERKGARGRVQKRERKRGGERSGEGDRGRKRKTHSYEERITRRETEAS